MNGAESLVRILIDSGMGACFANPATSEMQFVSGLARVKGLRCALHLAGTVVAVSARGYARMQGTPPLTLLHSAPLTAAPAAELRGW